MKRFIKLFAILSTLTSALFLTGCATSDNVSVSYSVGVGMYSGYGYPYYGYGGCCYNDIDRPDRPDRPDHPDRPDRPDRPSTKPAPNHGGSMGRPSRSQMSGSGRMPRGGGGRRR